MKILIIGMRSRHIRSWIPASLRDGGSPLTKAPPSPPGCLRTKEHALRVRTCSGCLDMFRVFGFVGCTFQSIFVLNTIHHNMLMYRDICILYHTIL